MKYECAKCKSCIDKGSKRTEGGSEFWFCATCSELLDRDLSLSILNFLGAQRYNDWFNSIQKNMRKARENRANGMSPWQNKALRVDK